jgi:hypothetical protein
VLVSGSKPIQQAKTAHGIRSSDFARLYIITLAVSVGDVESSTGQRSDGLFYWEFPMSNNLEAYMALAAQVSYDPESGIFVWLPRKGGNRLTRTWNTRFAGRECGIVTSKGYRVIGFYYDAKHRTLKSHRLAWLIVYGDLPEGEIDHINRDRADNRIANLRDVSQFINKRNMTMKRNNTSGITGVSWSAHSGKWLAAASVNGKSHHVGLFSCKNEAADAVKAFRAKHGFTESHGEAST